MRAFSVLFGTGCTYLCYLNKVNVVYFGEKEFLINPKGIAKVLNTSVSGIIEYSVRSESGCMVALQYQ